jgi:SSS family solute:Na+ symporter
VDTPVSLRMAGFEGGYAEGSFLWIVNNIYFQYYSLLIFLVSVAVMIGVSYLSEALPDKQIEGLTYATVTEEHRRESRSSWNHWDVASSGAVLSLIVIAYLYFTG